MTTWNYRVIRKIQTSPTDRIEYLEINEVYYDENGKPTSVTMDAIAPYGENIEKLASELKHMSEALTKPILDYSDFDE